jgi:hypothetical protein
MGEWAYQGWVTHGMAEVQKREDTFSGSGEKFDYENTER